MHKHMYIYINSRIIQTKQKRFFTFLLLQIKMMKVHVYVDVLLDLLLVIHSDLRTFHILLHHWSCYQLTNQQLNLPNLEV